MATFKRKTSEVEARQFQGPASLAVVHDIKGEKHAHKGDWLVGNERGKIEVLTNEEFVRDYEAVSGGDTHKEYSLGTRDAAVVRPLLNSSTDEELAQERGETITKSMDPTKPEPVEETGPVDENAPKSQPEINAQNVVEEPTPETTELHNETDYQTGEHHGEYTDHGGDGNDNQDTKGY